jgi:GLPGLI family protein
MKITVLSLMALIFLTATSGFSQNAHFTKTGTIEYEKTVNMFALIKREINKDNESYLEPAFEAYKKNQPQFKKLKSTLSFADNKTQFIPGESEESRSFFSDNAMVSQNNLIFTDLETNTFVDQKTVFEETFLLKDSTRKINWKITDETRDIAGFTCRRANAVILDSVYIVAFYTEKIPVSGGPESFNGLPGMILGLALPHENITWFATKVTEGVVDSKTFTPPKKGKPVDYKGLLKTLNGVMKDWGTWGQTYLKAFCI